MYAKLDSHWPKVCPWVDVRLYGARDYLLRVTATAKLEHRHMVRQVGRDAVEVLSPAKVDRRYFACFVQVRPHFQHGRPVSTAS